jgi:hypothetical protein
LEKGEDVIVLPSIGIENAKKKRSSEVREIRLYLRFSTHPKLTSAEARSQRWFIGSPRCRGHIQHHNTPLTELYDFYRGRSGFYSRNKASMQLACANTFPDIADSLSGIWTHNKYIMKAFLSLAFVLEATFRFVRIIVRQVVVNICGISAVREVFYRSAEPECIAGI